MIKIRNKIFAFLVTKRLRECILGERILVGQLDWGWQIDFLDGSIIRFERLADYEFLSIWGSLQDSFSFFTVWWLSSKIKCLKWEIEAASFRKPRPKNYHRIVSYCTSQAATKPRFRGRDFGPTSQQIFDYVLKQLMLSRLYFEDFKKGLYFPMQIIYLDSCSVICVLVLSPLPIVSSFILRLNRTKFSLNSLQTVWK